MDTSPFGVFKLLLPRLLLSLKTALLSKLSLSPNASKQDTTTEVVVAVIRSLLVVKKSVLIYYMFSRKEPSVHSTIHIGQAIVPTPCDAVRRERVRTIKEQGNGYKVTLRVFWKMAKCWDGLGNILAHISLTHNVY